MVTKIAVEKRDQPTEITVIKNDIFDRHGVSITDLRRKTQVAITGLSLDLNYDRVFRITSPMSAKEGISTRIMGSGRVVLTSNLPLESQTSGDVKRVIVTRKPTITIK